MFSAIVPEKRYTSCSTRLNSRRSCVELQLADIDAVDQNPSTRHVVEAQQQVDDRRLPRTRRPHDAHPFARPDLERHVLEHVVGPVVREPHVVEDDVAGSARIRDRGSGIGVRARAERRARCPAADVPEPP